MFLIPTCGRPGSVSKLILACHLYGMPPAAVMVSGDYSAVRWPPHWKIHYGGQEGMVKATNDLFRLYPNEPWYGFLNDRARPLEERWFERLLSAVDGGWANQYSSKVNPRTGRIRILNGIMDGDLTRRLGWFWPPMFRHLWVDDAMEDLLYDAGLFHQTDVKIDNELMPKHIRIGNDAAVYAESWYPMKGKFLEELCASSS